MASVRSWVLGTVVAGVVAAIGVGAYLRPDRAIAVAVNYVAQDVCAKTFVSRLPFDVAVQEAANREGIRLLRRSIRVETRAGIAVDATAFGLVTARAVFRPGLGCTLVHDPLSKPANVVRPAADSGDAMPGDLIAPSEPVSPTDAALASAIASDLVRPEAGTKAIVVVRDDRIVGEGYASGIRPDTPLIGYSLTKSVVSALVGILAGQRRIAVEKPAPIAAWQGPSDPRRAITVEHLLRMTSGLDLDETNSGFDASSRMLLLEDDMAAFAARAGLARPVGARWVYSSPSTILLCRIIAATLAESGDTLLAFAHRELFGPLGIQTVTMEFDAAGTLVGSTGMLASARDWARFGLLYANDGVAGGRRILPEGWVDFSARATAGAPYGAGFWTARGDHAFSRSWVRRGMPADAFFGSGDLGQRIVVVPSLRLVVVRLGHATDPTNDIAGLLSLVRAAAATAH